jgi:hypothetical protein
VAEGARVVAGARSTESLSHLAGVTLVAAELARIESSHAGPRRLSIEDCLNSVLAGLINLAAAVKAHRERRRSRLAPRRRAGSASRQLSPSRRSCAPPTTPRSLALLMFEWVREPRLAA